MDVTEYMEQRVEDQIGYYCTAANRSKRKHVWIQTCIILLGLLVPVVVNLPSEFFNAIGQSNAAVITVLSLTLASLTGIANFRKHGDLWLSYRTTEELLKKEKFLFLTAAGRYRDGEAAFSEFVATVESVISVEHEKFRSLVESARRPTTSAGPAAPRQPS